MKNLNTLLRCLSMAVLLTGASVAFCANTTKTVSQVTSQVTVSEDVDYVITGSTPFATAGSVDITNTEHAVVIIQAIKPSQVIKNYLKGRVFINGEQAEDGKNCQVKRYALGTIIFPYAKDIKPLTVYSEQNFGGTAVDAFGTENSGGYMNTLSAAKLNNQIRSFKLKRGYMVTFATGKSGWGYSRCFIADTEDLEVATLPAVFDMHITSYRVFKWFYAAKKGWASDTGASNNDVMNSTWCYDWGTGVDRLPDVECVPNHIYEDYPSSSACGSVTFSTMMKTNNEPGNSADDRPQDVETVLNNWQNLMRTGLRLASETSHDGSWGHLGDFIKAIDARGWRCDLLDLHCYWDGGFNNMEYYYNTYGKRPIIISEWVWGASWNNNGIFATDRSYSRENQQKNKDRLVQILSDLENSPYVERYAYWNHEADCSKLLKDGSLSLGGKYYADLNSNMAYRKQYERIPNVVYTKPEKLAGEWVKKNDGIYKLSWEDANGDIIEKIQVLCKKPGSKTYDVVAEVEPADLNGKTVTYTYTDTLTEAGAYYYQIVNVGPNNRKFTCDDEVSVSVAAAQSAEGLQFGQLAITDTESVTVTFTEPFDTIPAVFIGISGNANSNVGLSRKVSSVLKNKFSFAYVPWINGTAKELTKTENVDFMAIPYGFKSFADGQQYEVGAGKVSKDVVEIVFEHPFPEGVTPIVIMELRPVLNKPLLTKVWDITNTGFKTTIRGEEKETFNITNQNFVYLAISPGETRLGNGKKFYAGIGDNSLYGKTYKQEHFIIDGDTLMVKSPLVFGATQENNTDAFSVLRRMNDITRTGEDGEDYIIGMRIKRQVDETTKAGYTGVETGEAFGWLLLVDDDGPVDAVEGIFADKSLIKVNPVSRTISVNGGTAYELFTVNGVRLSSGSPLQPGVYVVKVGKNVTKVVVR